MFNKEKINELQEEIKELKSSNKKLKASMDKILGTLEGKNFSKEWEEYQKYKKMKNKLPDIEEMYNLKELKRLIIDKQHYADIEKKTTYEIIEFEKKHGNVAVSPERGGGGRINIISGGIVNPSAGYNTIMIKLTEINNNIDVILKKLRKNRSQKELLGIFKLYAINTKWLHP